LVAAGDDERAAHAGHRIGHDLFERGLPVSRDAMHVKLSRRDQVVDERAAADGADEHDVTLPRWLVQHDIGRDTGDPVDIGAQIPHGAHHTGVVACADHQRCGPPRGHQRKAPGTRLMVE